jgi:hypothetical protein
MNWRVSIRWSLKLHWSIEVFSFSLRAIYIIFWVHNLEIMLMVFSLFLGHESLNRFRVDWLTSVPIILNVVDVERVIFNSVRWGFEKVFVLIGVLFGSTFLIEKLFILGVIMMIILTLRHIRSIVPWCYVSIPR